jgi:hypothetical protein
VGSVQSFVPTKSTRFLDPDHARIASQAFEAALQMLGGKANTLSPHRLRHLLASFIVESVMLGEIDVERLALEAVESLSKRPRSRSCQVSRDEDQKQL